jgi:hypothetical protein|tara:strand:+ start:31784 stop:32191 length:408 start_codon:yes stop_codon:yes gene_type:complete
MNEDNPKIDLTEDEVKKVQWIVQLYGTIKELQGEIYAREKSKRYISIFTSGCVTYFIIKILHFVMETQSDAIVFFGAFVTLCLHYIIDNFTKAWNQAVSLRKFQKTLMNLEKERIELGIEDKDLDFSKKEYDGED